jgi:hypothetical protein
MDLDMQGGEIKGFRQFVRRYHPLELKDFNEGSVPTQAVKGR